MNPNTAASLARVSDITFPPHQPTLTAGNVRLRPWRVDDASVWAHASFDPEILSFTLIPGQVDIQSAIQVIKSYRIGYARTETAYFAVADAASNEALGSMAIIAINHIHRRGEIGYWMLPEARHHGIGHEALNMLTGWAINCGFARLELVTNVDNLGSQRLALSCDYVFEGTLRSYERGRQYREDLQIYSFITPGSEAKR